MGSNMQRQAVPLLNPTAPIVGTGIEELVARDSRVLIHAEKDGVVDYVDAKEIHVKYKLSEEDVLVSFDSDITVYHLTKFQKTNQGSAVNLRPIVKNVIQ
jgi:DNA-directed RNA polymerase subunit beta